MRIKGRVRRVKGATTFPFDSLSGRKSFFELTVDSGDTGIGDTVLGVFGGGSACVICDKLEKPKTDKEVRCQCGQGRSNWF